MVLMKSFYELEEYALVKDVPIMQKEGIEYLIDELNKIARAQNIPFNSYKIKSGGDHFNIIHPVTLLVAKKILADTNEKVNIQFSKEDIQWIENNIYK